MKRLVKKKRTSIGRIIFEEADNGHELLVNTIIEKLTNINYKKTSEISVLLEIRDVHHG
jgi:hypothetical protein